MARLNVTLRREPGALQGLLLTATHRGYEVTGVQASPDSDYFRVDLDVTSERSISLLARQLRRLYDVLEVEETT